MIRSKSTTLSHSCLTDAVVVYGWNEKSLKMVDDDDGGGGGRTNKCLWRNRNEEADSGAWEREEESKNVKFECDDLMRCQHTRQQRMLFLNYSTRYAKQSLCLGRGFRQIWIRGKDMRNEKLFSFLFFLRSLFSVGYFFAFFIFLCQHGWWQPEQLPRDVFRK